MNSINKSGRTLTINSKKVYFPREIEKALDFDHTVIVLLIPDKGSMVTNDIYGVRDGKIMWRVQDVKEYDSFYHTPFTMIGRYAEDNNLVIANDCEGFRFLINPHNGRIIGTESWVK